MRTQPTIRRFASSRGFSLIEVAVASGILAAMSLLIYSGFQLTFKARKESSIIQERFHTGQVAMSRMVKDLSAAFISEHFNMEERTVETFFIGKPRKLEFTYLGHLRIKGGSLETDQGAITYVVESDKDNPGTKALYRREKCPLDNDAKDGGIKLKLAENVKSIKFEYYDMDDEDWKSDWKAEMETIDMAGQPTDATSKKLQKSAELLMGDEGELNPFKLPDVVKITLILLDEQGREYPFFTEVRIFLKEPLKW